MYLYIVASGNGLFKIGKTGKVSERVAQIKSASPVECELLSVIEYDSGNIDLEKKLHAKFEKQRVRGEWFALSKNDLLSIIQGNEEIRILLEDMYSWGFFALGALELQGNVAKAALYRMQAIWENSNG